MSKRQNANIVTVSILIMMFLRWLHKLDPQLHTVDLSIQPSGDCYDNVKVNSKGHRQTMQIQIRRHIMWHLIRVYIVC